MNPTPDVSHLVAVPLGRAGVPPALAIGQEPPDELRQQTDAAATAATAYAVISAPETQFSAQLLNNITAGGILTHVLANTVAALQWPEYGWGIRAGNSIPPTLAQFLTLPPVYPKYIHNPYFPGLIVPPSGYWPYNVYPNTRLPSGYTYLIVGAYNEGDLTGTIAVSTTVRSPAP